MRAAWFRNEYRSRFQIDRRNMPHSGLTVRVDGLVQHGGFEIRTLYTGNAERFVSYVREAHIGCKMGMAGRCLTDPSFFGRKVFTRMYCAYGCSDSADGDDPIANHSVDAI